MIEAGQLKPDLTVKFIVTVEVKDNSYLSKAWPWHQVYS